MILPGWPRRILAVTAFVLLSPGLPAASATAGEDGWPDDDPERSALQVNEGRLEFIDPAPGRSILHSDTRLRLGPRSLETGWVEMHQCYRNLDAVDRTDVVYAYREMRSLMITRVEKITGHRVGQRTVELAGVAQGALLCVRAEVKILRRLANGYHAMRHGPYHRKFLDGYYPYHLSLEVEYPGSRIRLARVRPEPQPGFEVIETAGGLSIESWFEGELSIELEFTEK